MSEVIVTIRIYRNIVRKAFCQVCEQKQECPYRNTSDCTVLKSFQREIKKEYAIMNARRQYYDPSGKCLLKKYIHRHEKQLQQWEKKEKILTKALSEENNSKAKYALRNRLASAQAKIKYLRDLIKKERNSLKQIR